MSKDWPKEEPDRSMFDFSGADRAKEARKANDEPIKTPAPEADVQLEREPSEKAVPLDMGYTPQADHRAEEHYPENRGERAKMGCLAKSLIVVLLFSLVIVVGLFVAAPFVVEQLTTVINALPIPAETKNAAAGAARKVLKKEEQKASKSSAKTKALAPLGKIEAGQDCYDPSRKMVYSYVAADGSTAIVDNIASVPKNKRPTMTCRSLE